jgi:hypothetical protein
VRRESTVQYPAISTNSKRFGSCAAIASALLILARPAAAQTKAAYTFEYFRGTAFNAPLPLTIDQTGYPSISFTAHYSVRPTQDRAYYAFRLARWKNDRAWIVEELHHKVYLENPQDGVEHFEVTHGYNLITLDRGWRRGHYVLLFGGGIVLTFPHSTVRGQTYPQDTTQYQMSGAAVQGAAGRRFDLSRHVFLSVEGKLTAALARVPIVDGHASVPNLAVHVLGGAGVQF